MTVHFEISAILPASPNAIYQAWLDSTEHAAMTGGGANVSDQVGGSFSAWDDYISGTNIALEPGRRILQTWRTVEFEETDPDSQLEISFDPHEEGTKVTIRHTNLPPHGDQYEQGWVENYFEPMSKYFLQ